MPFATVGDIQMFYQDLGVPGGRPVVMIHGFTVTGSSDWAHQIPSTHRIRGVASRPAVVAEVIVRHPLDPVRLTEYGSPWEAGAARRLTSG
jgi:hypothetical protein